MLWKQRRKWNYYGKGLMALEYDSADFLRTWLGRISLKNGHWSSFEVVDLQKYQVYKDEKKVRVAIRENASVPFVFIAGKN